MAFRDALAWTRIPRYVVMLVGFALNAVLGVVDFYTGHDLVLSPFFVLPLALVTWYAGAAMGVVTAVISAGIWLTAEIADGVHSRPLILIVNTLIRLAFFLIITYLVAALRKAMRRLEASSHIDNLTGAANSAFFYDALGKELDRLGRYGRPLTLVYMDLDGFKSVNDRFGHLVGDRVLRVVAECATGRLRKSDVVARLGGDEFAFLCPETDEQAARAAIPKVIECLADEMRLGGWPVTFSVGVVTCHEVPDTNDALVKMADDLMYSVKLGTKNGISYASFGCSRTDSPLCDEETLMRVRRE